MSKSLSCKIILLLALLQGIFGLLRAYHWVEIGVDLFGQGIVLLPAIGVVAVMHGLFISLVALLYVLFCAGALLGRSWARWVGLAAAIINLFLALSALAAGVLLAEAIPWSVIPLMLLFFLLSPMGRDALKGAD